MARKTSIIHKAWRYLFPPRGLRERLPLLPTRYSSKTYRAGTLQPYIRRDWIQLLVSYGLAQTAADATKILRTPAYQSLPIDEIIKREQKKRRHMPKLTRAWRRLLRIW